MIMTVIHKLIVLIPNSKQLSSGAPSISPAAAVVPPWFGPAYAAAAAVPPPWFVPAIAAATAAALPPVLTAALAPLKAILNQMDENLTELSMCYCKDLNSFRQMPHVGPFHEVLLPDGRRPWNLVHNLPGPIPVVLPPLIDSQSIQNLSVNESCAYFILYYPNHDVGLYPHLLRLPEIRRAIGRPA
ncbi:hypothetical protein BT96DRAFT_984369 [Gymnopus androsaceus JB14]|uniref:Mug135-like C-terminal domain-containing protein n=1 Tax=Gymnopus androsaceus JB14 TaxID=1447944 RepID=A0A6A4ICY1_9AGAR|nr:hypothetical protein BT96DRAFT_984369 [Gymnopus androsaceus JB14]